MRDSVEILGIRVNNVSMQETLEILGSFVAEGIPRIVVTADAAGIVAAQTDEEWREILLSADLVTPDSVGVLWAAKRAGTVIAERVSGVELVEKLVASGIKCYFLGAAPGIAQTAADNLRRKYANAQIVGARDGFFGADDEPEVVSDIRATQPDALFVAMGIPKQEKFIRRHMQEIGASINMGVGGSFDVLSGTVKRAPVVLQRLRLEWLWRLIQNPKKWRKVAALPRFWWLVLTSRRGQVTN